MIILDGKEFVDRQSSYEYLNEKIEFDYEVNNLDALYDSLTMIDDSIEIINYEFIIINLGEYGYKFLKVFIDAYVNEDISLNLIGF